MSTTVWVQNPATGRPREVTPEKAAMLALSGWPQIPPPSGGSTEPVDDVITRLEMVQYVAENGGGGGGGSTPDATTSVKGKARILGGSADAPTVPAGALTGTIDPARLPPLAIIDYLGAVASQSAMLALTGQKGDWCVRTDTGKGWIITGSDPTQLSSWTILPYPAATMAGLTDLDQGGAAAGKVVAVAAVDGQGKVTGWNLITPAAGGGGGGAVSSVAGRTGDVVIGWADLSGLVPTSKLPPLSITDVFPVANQAARLALTAQRGDIAVQADNGTTYALSTDDPTQNANWIVLPAIGKVQTVNGQQGAVVLGKGDVGLANVDNTADADKPVSTAAAAELAKKAGRLVPTADVKTSDYAAVDRDLVRGDPTGGSFSVQLPAATDGRRIAVKDVRPSTSTSTNTITVLNPDASVAVIIRMPQQTRTLIANGTEWTIESGQDAIPALDRRYAPALAETTTKTSAYTAAAGDLVVVDSTTALVPVTLPAAAAVGAQVGVNVAAGTNPALVSAATGDVIGSGNDTAFALPARTRTVILQKTTGGRWRFLAGAEHVQMIAFGSDFTGTNGAAWDTSKFTQMLTPSGGSGATIQSNRGRLTTNNAGGYGAADKSDMRVNTTVVPSTTTDTEQLVSFVMSNSAEMYPYVYARRGANSYYGAVLNPTNLTLQKLVSGTFINVIVFTQTYTPGTKYWLRFRVVGTYLTAKTWADGTPEPELWTVAATDGSLTAGWCGLGIGGGSAAHAGGVDYVDFDDYAIYTTVPVATVSADPTGRGLIRERDTAREWIMRARSALTFPVPAIRAAPGKTLAFDVMPGPGASHLAGEGYAWLDVCDRDCLDGDLPVATARVGATSTAAEFGSRAYSGATLRPVRLTVGGATVLELSTTKTVFVADATAPTGNPTGGGYLYVESGSLKFRGSSGTVTTIAPA